MGSLMWGVLFLVGLRFLCLFITDKGEKAGRVKRPTGLY